MADVEFQNENGVLWITLNRPEQMGALTSEMRDQIVDQIWAARDDTAVRALVITGKGKGFCTGADLSGGAPPTPWVGRTRFTMRTGSQKLLRAIWEIEKPVICAVKGAVAGAGFSLMLGCDLVIAKEGGVFTLAYCHLGTSPDGGSTWHLPRTLGMKRAMEIALLGDRFGPEKALEWGLINKVVPEAEFDAEVAKLAKRLAAGPTLAYGRTKRLLLESSDNDMDTQLGLETENFVNCAMSKDFKKGVTAFVEKQKPDFTGE